MNFLMTMGLKMLGLQSALDAVNGETSKAYLAGLGKIAAGAATAFGGLASLATEIIPLHSATDYLGFVQHLKADPAAAVVVAGYLAICSGYGDIGQRHAVAKAANGDEPKIGLP